MKRGVFCGSCKVLTRATTSYKVKVPVEKISFSPVDGQQITRQVDEVITICRNCAAKAGYKVKREKSPRDEWRGEP
jgi:hypothetical protein